VLREEGQWTRSVVDGRGPLPAAGVRMTITSSERQRDRLWPVECLTAPRSGTLRARFPEGSVAGTLPIVTAPATRRLGWRDRAPRKHAVRLSQILAAHRRRDRRALDRLLARLARGDVLRSDGMTERAS
jgi:hypothetical protein